MLAVRQSGALAQVERSFTRMANAAESRPEGDRIFKRPCRRGRPGLPQGGRTRASRYSSTSRSGAVCGTRGRSGPDLADRVHRAARSDRRRSIGATRNWPSVPFGFGFTVTPADELADPVVILAWRCLEARLPAGYGRSGADAANIAADLVRLDPERGFRLVETAAARLVAAMRNPGSDIYGIWSPFEPAGRQRPCWETMRSLDRDRALRIVLDHAAQAGPDGLHLSLQLKHLIRMPDDADFLRTYAAQGVAEADTVASAIASSGPGFWDIACEIVERYPENEQLRRRLGIAAGGFAGGFFFRRTSRNMPGMRRRRLRASSVG